MNWIKKHWIFLTIVLLIIGFSILFYFISPEDIVDRVGVKNSYLIAFLVAVFAGVSSITGASYFATITTLSQGGINPWILGFVGGVGLFISDSIFYYAATKGAKIVSNYKRNLFEKIEYWVTHVRPLYVYLGIIAYTSFLPLPNDILLIVLAISSYSYKKFFPFLLTGGISVSLIFSLLSS